MRGMVARAGLLAAGLLMGFVGSAQAQPDQRLDAILDALRQKGEAQAAAMHQRALECLAQAEAALKAGMTTEARDLAAKAIRLDPEAPDVKAGYRQVLNQLRDRREAGIQRLLVQEALREGLDQVEALLREGDGARANDLAVGMRGVLEKLPPGIDAQFTRQAIEALLGDPRMASRPPPPFEAVAPDRVQQALAKKINVDWRNEPLDAVLRDLTRQAGVVVALDEDLHKLRLAERKRVDLLVTNGTTRQVLRLLTERLNLAYVESEGMLILMDKRKAGDFVPAPPPERAPAGRDAPREVKPMVKVPERLQSGKAFASHVEELLRLER